MAGAPVGFIGIGNMGAPMARRLAAAGHALVLHDRCPAAAEALAAEAASLSVARDLPEVAARCGVVITMLPDANVVRAAVMGEDGARGLVPGLARGSTVVDMSSSAPMATRDLGRALDAHGIALVDAPVSGGVPRARDGTLTIMAGGAPATVSAVEPLLAAMGSVHRTGPLGAGHAMKALNNYVSAAGLIAVCEALIVARAFDLDPQVLNRVLNASTGRNNTTDKKVEPYILNRAFDSGFALDLMRKDVGIANDLARGLALDAPWLAGCAEMLERASATLGPGADHTAVFAFLEQVLQERSGGAGAP